jgi:transcriptional regulator with XRE-family HTH domain
MTPDVTTLRVTRFGPRVAAMREARGQRVADLAAAAGIGRTTLAEIENGTSEPSIRSVLRVCGALGVGLDAIFAAGPDTPGFDCTFPGYYGPCTGACQTAPDLG